MPSHAKTLIDALRKAAIGLDITSTLSRDRDMCAHILYGRPYASVIPAEEAGSLGLPTISPPHAVALVEKHGASGQQLLQAASIIVQQETGGGDGADHAGRDHRGIHLTREQHLEKRAGNQHLEISAPELKQVSIDIDYVACKGSGILSDTLFERIQANGKGAGYAVNANFVDRGGDSTNPIARIGVSGATKAETERALEDISALAREAFRSLLAQTNISGSELLLAAEDAFRRDAIQQWRKITPTTFAFQLKGIPTNIRIALTPSRGSRGGFDFRLSHIIHTPAQIGPYRPSNPWGDDLLYALNRAITSVTMYYDTAIERGFSPSPDWLVPNDA